MTWKEIRDECLKLMYSYSKKGSVIPQTDGNLKDYTLAMPGAANIALYDIARVLPDIRKYTAVQAEADTAGRANCVYAVCGRICGQRRSVHDLAGWTHAMGGRRV